MLNAMETILTLVWMNSLGLGALRNVIWTEAKEGNKYCYGKGSISLSEDKKAGICFILDQKGWQGLSQGWQVALDHHAQAQVVFVHCISGQHLVMQYLYLSPKTSVCLKTTFCIVITAFFSSWMIGSSLVLQILVCCIAVCQLILLW